MTVYETLSESAKVGLLAAGGMVIGIIGFSLLLGTLQGILESIGSGVSLAPLIPFALVVGMVVAGYFVTGRINR